MPRKFAARIIHREVRQERKESMRKRSYVQVGSTDFPSSFALFAPFAVNHAGFAVNHAGLRSGRKICVSRLAVALRVPRKCPRLCSISVAATPRWVIRGEKSGLNGGELPGNPCRLKVGMPLSWQKIGSGLPHPSDVAIYASLAAGLTNHVWEIEDLAALVEAEELRAIEDGELKRGKYKSKTSD